MNNMEKFIVYAIAGYTISEMVNKDWDQYDSEFASFVKGLDMDELMKHSIPEVRIAVAAEGHGLCQLIKDPDPYVRQTAEMMMGSIKKTIIE